jgi:integral membrane sensor domain MASE1
VFSQPIASLMATESTRRALTEPAREAPVRLPRRAVALALQRAAHRLDPCVTASPRLTLGR